MVSRRDLCFSSSTTTIPKIWGNPRREHETLVLVVDDILHSGHCVSFKTRRISRPTSNFTPSKDYTVQTIVVLVTYSSESRKDPLFWDIITDHSFFLILDTHTTHLINNAPKDSTFQMKQEISFYLCRILLNCRSKVPSVILRHKTV